MTHEEYAAIPGRHFSAIKLVDTSLMAYQYALANPRQSTPALALGSLTHCAVLEPLELIRRYTLAPECDRRTNAGKQAHADALAAAGDRELVKADDYDLAVAMGAAVRAHPVAARYLAHGRAEVLMQWRDEETGLPCKGRADWIVPDGDIRAVVDLKTDRDIGGRFPSTVARMLYHAQLAFYVDGWRAMTGTHMDAVIIAVEKAAPFDVGVFRLRTEALELGRDLYRKWLTMIMGAERSGRWSGRYTEIQELDVPRWSYGDGEGDGFEEVEAA